MPIDRTELAACLAVLARLDGPGLDDAARRYAEAFRTLVASEWGSVLVLCHEIPVRYALNAAAGSDSLDGPAHEISNAVPYLFDEGGVERAVRGIERLVGGRIPR